MKKILSMKAILTINYFNFLGNFNNKLMIEILLFVLLKLNGYK